MNKIWLAPRTALLLLATQAFFAPAHAQEFSVAGSVTVIGGAVRSSGDLLLEDVIGESAVGSLSSPDFQVESGDPVHNPLNQPPLANAGGPYLTAVGKPVALTGALSWDPDGDVLRYLAWTQAPDVGTLTYEHGYNNPTFTAGPAAAIAELRMAVDDGSLEGSATARVVIYNPEGGFVTGGGWIASPAGAWAGDRGLTGKMNFGFVAKYLKGATAPAGQLKLQFKEANLNFKGSTYEWLVVNGSQAMCLGTGTINGTGSYHCMVTVVDGDLAAGRKPDTFRVRIWSDGDGVVYDSGLGAPDTAAPSLVVGGGSIVITNP